MSINIPGYTLIRVLGKGGMATVYLAKQIIFEREVALKVMTRKLSDDPKFGKRFFREAKIVSQLVHPNIVTVYDVGVYEGVFYLSMEYIDGGDLRQRRKEFGLPQKVNAIRDIAKALQFAAQKGYVHRDIKPENIMFHQGDGRGVLTDFGIARAAETDISMTQTGMAIGTPHYMSPEQAKGHPVDSRSDLYSLGVVFYLQLAGKVPYDGDSAVTIGIKHITEPVPILSEDVNGFQPMIDKLMAKKVNDRYSSAAEFIDDLDQYCQVNRLHFPDSMPDRRKKAQVPQSTFDESESDDEMTHDTQCDMSQLIDTHLPSNTNYSSILSWMVSFLVVSSLLLVLVYVMRPVAIEPWIEQTQAMVERAVKRIDLYWRDK